MLEAHYTAEDDGLSKSWAGEVVFCNPPYGREIKHWVAKCHEESKHAKVMLLIPARTDTAYFHDHIYHDADEIRFLRGRLKFELNGIPGDAAPFPSMIVIYNNKSKDSYDATL